MNFPTILFISVTVLLFLVSSTQGEDVVPPMNDDFEVSQETATTFLGASPDLEECPPEETFNVPVQRETGNNCVRCKFGLNPCCAPNICVKKFLLPDECQDVKTGG